jgi:hypothetical protein
MSGPSEKAIPYVKAWEEWKFFGPSRRYSMFDRRFPGGKIIVSYWRPDAP